MDLNALGLFITAARTGSLSEAARQSRVPLPTLSRRVRKLERDLGVRLLERGPRGLALTPAGARLVEDAGPALASLVEAEQRLHDREGIAGTLRISIPPNFEPGWTLLSEFGELHPAVRFEVFVTERSVDLVADGIDVVLRVGDRGFRSYHGRTLARYRHQVVAAPALIERQAIEAPEDLRSVPCVGWRTPERLVWSVGGRDLSIEPLLVVNDYAHLLQLALSGKAVTELPPFLARRPIQDGRLVPVLPDHPMPEVPVRALVVEKRSMPALIREFLDVAVERFPDIVHPRVP